MAQEFPKPGTGPRPCPGLCGFNEKRVRNNSVERGILEDQPGQDGHEEHRNHLPGWRIAAEIADRNQNRQNDHAFRPAQCRESGQEARQNVTTLLIREGGPANARQEQRYLQPRRHQQGRKSGRAQRQAKCARATQPAAPKVNRRPEAKKSNRGGHDQGRCGPRKTQRHDSRQKNRIKRRCGGVHPIPAVECPAVSRDQLSAILR